MKSEPCIICASTVEVHIDDLRNHHINCPQCGNYIATDGFSAPYQKLDELTRHNFADWMLRNKDKPNRFLFKTKPLKSNPYSAAEGFNMVSISRIQSGSLEPEKAESV